MSRDLLVEFLSGSLKGGGSLNLGRLGLLALSGFLGSGLRLSGSGGIRGDLLQGLDGLDGVLLSEELGSLGLSWVDNRLDLIGVNDSGKIGIGHLSGREGTLTGSGTVHSIKLGEGGFSVDDESTHVSSWGKLKKVKSLDVAKLNTGEVSESLFNSVIGGIDDKWSSSHGVSAVTHLTLTGSNLLGVNASSDILVGTDLVQTSLGGSALAHVLNVSNDQRALWDLGDGMTSGHDKGWNGGGGKSRGNGESTLSLVDLPVPLSPGLGWGEHSTGSAHVSERGLTGSLGSSSGNSWNSGNGSTSSPRNGRGLVSSIQVHGVSLSVVLVHVGVNKLNDIRSKWGQEDGWKGGGTGLGSSGGEDGDDWSG